MKSTYIYIGLVVLVIGGLIIARNSSSGERAERVTKFDTFAQCITDAGVKFYGAYWCPHCVEQKRLFENSNKLPYIECSTPDGNSQLPLCVDEKIEGYPTWEFADGERVDHVMQLSELAEKTNCEVPQV